LTPSDSIISKDYRADRHWDPTPNNTKLLSHNLPHLRHHQFAMSLNGPWVNAALGPSTPELPGVRPAER
jgi:hypothetical protein